MGVFLWHREPKKNEFHVASWLRENYRTVGSEDKHLGSPFFLAPGPEIARQISPKDKGIPRKVSKNIASASSFREGAIGLGKGPKSIQ